MEYADYKALFDRGVERRGTNCVKWDALGSVYHNPDAIPLWVADTDFAAPPEVIAAVEERARHGAFGYSAHGGEDVRAAAAWLRDRQGIADACTDWLVFCPGVVDALYVAVLALTEPGDRVVVQPPVYGPFFSVVERSGRTVRENRLLRTEEGGWRMDLADLEAAFREGAKLLLLCSPHNPVGRVWTREELTEVAALCGRYGVTIVADEIHSDIVMPGHTHSCMLGIPGAEDAVVAMAPSKTFNLAGLCHSFFAVRSEEKRRKIAAQAGSMGLGGSNVFGEIACAAAYTYGAPWVDALDRYLQENRSYAEAFFAERMPEVGVTKGEGTFLMWLDLTAWGLKEDELNPLLSRCGAALSGGRFFGKEWDGWMRLNIGTPRRVLEQGLQNVLKARNEALA